VELEEVIAMSAGVRVTFEEAPSDIIACEMTVLGRSTTVYP
jgi:hypothetical protein